MAYFLYRSADVIDPEYHLSIEQEIDYKVIMYMYYKDYIQALHICILCIFLKSGCPG